jgi:hypothetical protein
MGKSGGAGGGELPAGIWGRGLGDGVEGPQTVTLETDLG